MLVRVVCVFLAGVLGSRPAAETVPPGLADRLAQFDERTSRIEDLTARFEQQKHSILLRRPLVSRGSVRVKGEAIRWDTREPIESVITVNERDARIYYPDQNLVEIYPLGADLRFLAGSPVPRLALLDDRFEIRPANSVGLGEVFTRRDGAFVVSLTPRDERLAERIERIRLVLDEEVGVMRLFELVDPQGDRWVVMFDEIRINQGLKDEDVALRVPEGVRISRPFGGEQRTDERDERR